MRTPPTPPAPMFRPGTRLAVTIPSVDPQRGRLTGIVVQLLTLVVDATERTSATVRASRTRNGQCGLPRDFSNAERRLVVRI